MKTIIKRNDLVIFMAHDDLPRVGLVTHGKSESKDYVIIYELGRRHEVHRSQIRKTEKQKP